MIRKENLLPAVILFCLLLCGCLCHTEKYGQGACLPDRRGMDRTRLNIGAYTLRGNHRTEEHIRDIAACGIDFMVCVNYDREMLDRFQKYGIGAVVTGVLPGWWGGDGHNAGTLQKENPLEKYTAAAKSFQDHPAIWGIDIGDEPSALDFPYYGKVFQCVKEHFPNQFPYLNLYPNYASVSENNAVQTVNQLGTPTYAEHIEKYCENLPSDYLCYDYYLYSAGVERHYENLRIVADACRKSGRSLWIVLQVNSKDEAKWITTNQLRFQANSALAFGAENIIWACYSRAWWFNQVLDDDGNKTQQYEKLRTVNAEIHSLADKYMRYRNVATHFVSFPENAPDLAQLTQTDVLPSLSTGIFNDLKSEENCGIIVGQMAPRTPDGSAALFLCTADDPQDVNPRQIHVSFRCEGFQVTAQGAQLARNDDGTYLLTMASSGGALLVAEP
ncbi:MAG: hypothetical protein J6Y80_02590 [Victivallales bacterium]|nr:hypothetical protein [Victivallales bacterium]